MVKQLWYIPTKQYYTTIDCILRNMKQKRNVHKEMLVKKYVKHNLLFCFEFKKNLKKLH